LCPNRLQGVVVGVGHRYTTNHTASSEFCDGSLPDSIHCLRRNYTMSFVRLPGYADLLISHPHTLSFLPLPPRFFPPPLPL